MIKKSILIITIILTMVQHSRAQKDPAPKDISKFDRMNKKAEAFFKVAPVPIISYSTEAGQLINITNLEKYCSDLINFNIANFFLNLSLLHV